MVTDDGSVWRALADPTRRTILEVLRAGPATTGALTERFAQSRFGVMKHLDVLLDCGLIAVERRGKERWNYLNAFRLREAAEAWLTPFQAQWSNRLADLVEHVQETSIMPLQPSPLGLDIRQEAELPASMERVFRGLTQDINRWWTFRQTGAAGVLTLKPDVGADMVERSSDGHAVIWARVEEVRPPDRLYLAGRFAVQGAVAGRIHFDLSAVGDHACRLVVSHQAVGAISEDMQANFGTGWRQLLGESLPAYLGTPD